MHRSTCAVIVAAALASTVLVAPGAGAQTEPEPEPPSPLPLAVEPTSGAVGDAFVVSGSECDDTFGLGHHVDVYFFLLRDDLPPDTARILTFNQPIVPADDGTWVGHMTVPDSDGDWVTDPELNYGVQARCRVDREDGVDGVRHSEIVPFDVLATPVPTTPTTTPPSPTTPDDGSPVPPPATPVVAAPSFTG